MSKRDIILKRKRVLYIDVLKIKERNKRKKIGQRHKSLL
jgi:predicted protein tyrosine phosphatase